MKKNKKDAKRTRTEPKAPSKVKEEPAKDELSEADLESVNGGTANLFTACATGKHITTVKIEM
jgi:hypothetical protein